MINSEIFRIEFTKLLKHFGKDIVPDQFQTMKEILSEELDTHEFLTACKNAVRDYQFFPTPRQLIDSVRGTLEERALTELQNLDRLSVVGRKAFEAIGGNFAYKNSESQEFFRKDFVKHYLALAKDHPPDATRMPVEAAKALPSAVIPKHFDLEPQPYDMPLWEKLEILKCKRRVKGLKEAAEIEARAFGFRITENDFLLAQGQDPNQPISSMTLDITELVKLFTKTDKVPVGVRLAEKDMQTLQRMSGKIPKGIIGTQFEREVEF